MHKSSGKFKLKTQINFIEYLNLAAQYQGKIEIKKNEKKCMITTTLLVSFFYLTAQNFKAIGTLVERRCCKQTRQNLHR